MSLQDFKEFIDLKKAKIIWSHLPNFYQPRIKIENWQLRKMQ